MTALFVTLGAMLRRAVESNWFVFATTVLMHRVLIIGQSTESLDRVLYIRLADALRHGDVTELLEPTHVRWTKTMFISVLALARAVSPAHWETIMLAVNLACSGLTAVLVVGVVRRATRSTAAAAAALALYVATFEIFQWIPFVALTDTMYVLAAFLSFALVARGIYDSEEVRWRRPLLVLSVVAACFARPTGALLVPLVVYAEWILGPTPRRARPGRKALLVLWVGFVVVTSLGRAYVVHDVDRWPFAFVRPTVAKFAADEQRGHVIYGVPEPGQHPTATVVDHVILQMDRFTLFFRYKLSAGYSWRHNAAVLVYFIPLHVFGLVGIIHGLLGADRRRRSLILAALLWVGGFAYFHALTVFDNDRRYRMPLFPELVVLAACGVDVLWRRVPVRRVDPVEDPT